MSDLQGDNESLPVLKRLTELDLITFNSLCVFRSEFKVSPSIQELKDYMKSPSTRQSIYERLLRLTNKGYLQIDERGKYYPTRRGVSQCITDWATPGRRLKRNKGASRYGSYSVEVASRRVSNIGELRELQRMSDDNEVIIPKGE